MKFRMFTLAVRGYKVAVNIDRVRFIEVADAEEKTTYIYLDGRLEATEPGEPLTSVIEVSEDFDTVFSRLNTIAE